MDFENLLDLNCINKNDIVAVGVSGGIDSMCLLHILLFSSSKYNFNVRVINIDHNIRQETSKKDSEFVKSYCNKNNILIKQYSIDVLQYSKDEKMSIEEAARELRYKCFYDAINNNFCNKVATAHHLSDNIETLLYNIFRGTSIKGLCGIKNSDDNKIIRPLKHIKKDDIINYALHNNIQYVNDETNMQDVYDRNYIRLNIIPLIKKRFNNYENSFNKLINLANENVEFINTIIKNNIVYKNFYVELNIVNINQFLFGEMFINALKYLNINKDWSYCNIEYIYNVFCKSKNNSVMYLFSNKIKLIKSYNMLYIVKNINYTNQDKILFVLGIIKFNDYIITTYNNVTYDNTNNHNLCIDYDKIPNNTYIRSRQNNDIVHLKNGIYKKINDLFSDLKIPLLERDRIPMLVHNNNVLCIFTHNIISKDIQSTNNTKNFMLYNIKYKL